MGDRTVTAADVEAIATLPSREELQARLLGMLVSPMAGPFRSSQVRRARWSTCSMLVPSNRTGSGRRLEHSRGCPTGRLYRSRMLPALH